jgi:hypothetical protein
VPLNRFVDIEQNLDLLANGITFNRSRARQLIEQYLSRRACTGNGCQPRWQVPKLDGPGETDLELAWKTTPDGARARFESEIAREFFQKAITQQLSPRDVMRITITSFMDAYNFDVRQLMKSCVHHILPSGHIIPFSAYNVLYRDGHVPLPPLDDIVDAAPTVGLKPPVVSPTSHVQLKLT